MNLKQVQDILPEHPPASFCLAPFIGTMQTPYGKTSPCAYGVTEWQYDALTPKQRWETDDVNQMRATFARGETPEPCQKCVNEQLAGKNSLRQRMTQWHPSAYQDIVLSGKWQQGPMIISSKVSNVCNIACRSCAGWDSNKFAKEGQHYVKVYNTNHDRTLGNRFVPRLPPRHTDYTGFDEIADNVVHLEFFGGEPLLNHTHLDLLQQLIDTGRSKHTTLFYSTNCTQKITPVFLNLWQHFKKLEINLSIDHIGEKFEYLRWPGRWSEVEQNIKDILDIENKIGVPVSSTVAICATLNNFYYIDEVVDWAVATVGSSYINMVAAPLNIALHVAPDYVKRAVEQHVKNPEVIGFMNLREHNPLEWRRFIVWNKRQDLYRKQDFTRVFSEFYAIIKHDWDAVEDLSEDSFNNLV